MQVQSTPGDHAGQPLRPGVRVEATVSGTAGPTLRRGTILECGARVMWDDEDAPVYVPARDPRPVRGC